MSGRNKKKDKKKSLIKSFDFALKGLAYAIKTERSMRIHIIIAILILVVALFLNLTRTDLILIVITISLVLITEILNTACELIVNMITDE
ncbi:MAG: diacylglycerol kinase family protein, partial [Elusimicrobiota bacterium]